MSPINLNDYIAGGYFVARYATDGFWKSPIMPERVISLSDCISKTVNVYWGWNTEQHKVAILDFGIPEEKLPALKDWSVGKDVGHPNVFYSLQAAQQFIADFLPNDKDLLLLGTGLPTSYIARFLSENPLWTVDARGNRLERDPFGIHLGFLNKQPLSADGEIRGFEILSFEYHLGQSWLCSNIEKDMHELYGIQPNQYGLIDTYEEALKVYEWIAEDKMQGSRAELEPYYPWLIVQYPTDPPEATP